VNTVTLSPSGIFTDYVFDYWTNPWCFDGGNGGLEIGPDYSAAPGQFIAGLEDIDQGGGGPFACEKIFDYNFRGAVAFDLSQFQKVIGATLKVDIPNSISANGEVVSQNPPVCNATVVAEASGSDEYAFDPSNSKPLPTCGPYNIGVTEYVKDWLNGTPNFGFIFAGPRIDFPNSLPNDNSAAITSYSNFQLVIVYNTADNPKAPQ
jgi:hypothetical protein